MGEWEEKQGESSETKISETKIGDGEIHKITEQDESSEEHVKDVESDTEE